MSVKRKWISFNFNEKKQKTDDNERCEQKYQTDAVLRKDPINNEKLRNFKFLQHLEPKRLEDLAVHPKKIKDVELWLNNYVINPHQKNPVRMLLLTGPSGCGKTTTVQMLCKCMDINVEEWINPVVADYENHHGPGQATKLLDFLMDSKYPSLLTMSKCNRQVTLLKDFPNTLINNRDQFDGILSKHVSNVRRSLIFICTDVNSNNSINISKNLFTPELRLAYNIDEISFNACSATLMKGVLTKAQNVVKANLDILKMPGASVLDAVIASSMGDIRCAINQYYFASLKGADDIPIELISITNKTDKKRKRVAKGGNIKAMLRNESLGLFHGLGRVLNPKRREVGSTWRLDCDIGPLVDEFSMQPNSFVGFLHENYVKYFGDIGDVCGAADVLSMSQTILDNWVDRHETLLEMAMWIAVLGTMAFNDHRVSKWTQIVAPKRVKKVINTDMESRRLGPTDQYYIGLIKKDQDMHQFKYQM